MEVYESAGTVQFCVRIIKPTRTRKLEFVYYRLQLSTEHNSSKLCRYYFYCSLRILCVVLYRFTLLGF